MTSWALSLILISTISFPFLITNQYTQVIPLLLNYVCIIYVLKPYLLQINQIKGILGGCLLVLVSSMVFQVRFDFLALSYICAALLFALSYQFALNYSRINSRYILILFRATALIPFLVFASILFDYLFPGILDHFKSNPSLLNEFLVLRSKSGILPEPSFIGSICSLSYLFLTCQIIFNKFYPHLNLTFWHYKIFSLAFSFLAIVTSVSISSVISSIGYFSVAFILGGEVNSILSIPSRLIANLKLNRFFFYIIAIMILSVISTLFFFSIRSATRIGYLVNMLLAGNFSLNQDESVVDRSLSTVFGLTSAFISPFGFGINGFSAALSSCPNNFLVNVLSIDCTLARSTRNHNLIANYLQDFGFLGFLYIVYCANLIRVTYRRIHLVIAAFLLVGLTTPNTLVSPLFWYTFAFLSFLPRIMTNSITGNTHSKSILLTS